MILSSSMERVALIAGRSTSDMGILRTSDMDCEALIRPRSSMPLASSTIVWGRSPLMLSVDGREAWLSELERAARGASIRAVALAGGAMRRGSRIASISSLIGAARVSPPPPPRDPVGALSSDATEAEDGNSPLLLRQPLDGLDGRGGESSRRLERSSRVSRERQRAEAGSRTMRVARIEMSAA